MNVKSRQISVHARVIFELVSPKLASVMVIRIVAVKVEIIVIVGKGSWKNKKKVKNLTKVQSVRKLTVSVVATIRMVKHAHSVYLVSIQTPILLSKVDYLFWS